jgi:hypothetical protein
MATERPLEFCTNFGNAHYSKYNMIFTELLSHITIVFS